MMMIEIRPGDTARAFFTLVLRGMKGVADGRRARIVCRRD
jgi:hypothetical protein